jgi:nuclear transport factor 2 (NTF2) superfamily protein
VQTTDEKQQTRPPVPVFAEETARQKVKMAQDAWNTRDPEKVALAYTEDYRWRNRDKFLEGLEAIVVFLRCEWARELDYRGSPLSHAKDDKALKLAREGIELRMERGP